MLRQITTISNIKKCIAIYVHSFQTATILRYGTIKKELQFSLSVAPSCSRRNKDFIEAGIDKRLRVTVSLYPVEMRRRDASSRKEKNKKKKKEQDK